MFIIYFLLGVVLIIILYGKICNKNDDEADSENYLPGIRDSYYDKDIIKRSGGMAGFGFPYMYDYNPYDMYYPQSMYTYNPYDMHNDYINQFRVNYYQMPIEQLDVYNRINSIYNAEYYY